MYEVLPQAAFLFADAATMISIGNGTCLFQWPPDFAVDLTYGSHLFVAVITRELILMARKAQLQ